VKGTQGRAAVPAGPPSSAHDGTPVDARYHRARHRSGDNGGLTLSLDGRRERFAPHEDSFRRAGGAQGEPDG
jgi:hypothetical protein